MKRAATSGLSRMKARSGSPFTAQGATVLIVMPLFAYSRASPVVRPCTPPLAAL